MTDTRTSNHSRFSILCQRLNNFGDLTWSIVFLNQLGQTYQISDVSLLFPRLFCNYQSCLLRNWRDIFSSSSMQIILGLSSSRTSNSRLVVFEPLKYTPFPFLDSKIPNRKSVFALHYDRLI
jgi:hypothetical protein